MDAETQSNPALLAAVMTHFNKPVIENVYRGRVIECMVARAIKGAETRSARTRVKRLQCGEEQTRSHNALMAQVDPMRTSSLTFYFSLRLQADTVTKSLWRPNARSNSR